MKKIKQAVLFAGGRGTRLSEKTNVIPKPLVEVQGEPIIIHIMRNMAKAGIKEFVILTGYLSECFVDYFINNRKRQDYIEITDKGVNINFNADGLEGCTIKLVYTGEESGTAVRLWKAKDLLDDNFVLTYGDSFSNVDMRDVEKKFLEKDGTVLTLTGIRYKERFGIVDISGETPLFREKAVSETELVNGGFMCINKKGILERYEDVAYPEDFMKDIMSQEELRPHISVYTHEGYWKAVDTMKDLEDINKDFEIRTDILL